MVNPIEQPSLPEYSTDLTVGCFYYREPRTDEPEDGDFWFKPLEPDTHIRMGARMLIQRYNIEVNDWVDWVTFQTCNQSHSPHKPYFRRYLPEYFQDPQPDSPPPLDSPQKGIMRLYHPIHPQPAGTQPQHPTAQDGDIHMDKGELFRYNQPKNHWDNWGYQLEVIPDDEANYPYHIRERLYPPPAAKQPHHRYGPPGIGYRYPKS